jgi:hypothetical protein
MNTGRQTAGRELVCIACPVGCRLRVSQEQDGEIRVSGNQCEKGDTYGREELLAPKRVVTATVRRGFPPGGARPGGPRPGAAGRLPGHRRGPGGHPDGAGCDGPLMPRPGERSATHDCADTAPAAGPGRWLSSSLRRTSPRFSLARKLVASSRMIPRR